MSIDILPIQDFVKMKITNIFDAEKFLYISKTDFFKFHKDNVYFMNRLLFIPKLKEE
jgi:hypothetical protein